MGSLEFILALPAAAYIISKIKIDAELREVKRDLRGKVFVEELKTKINRHEIAWIGRSKADGRLRIGIRFRSAEKLYFYDLHEFLKEPQRCKLMTISEADALEKSIIENKFSER